ncbi:putative acetyltransferase EpsM [Andreesenia angusta]|uniref:Putative acetyltransferase EpsM n=1 Tax=Andreesenia angusta TaxID=39480 RepID=A0A1S1V6H4_9FIRM|nr:acetyltransferase [Andreesenia angusta]OHW61980.1 putative acetyltransferase EpsM [Andreesenia angusta]
MEKIVLVGGGGHSKVIIDIIKSRNDFKIVGITDNRNSEEVLDIPIIGDDTALKGIYNGGVNNAFVCIGAIENTKIRSVIYENLKVMGFKLPILIHSSAYVSPYAKIGKGTCIMNRAVVNPDAIVGCNCVVNTGAILEHESVIGNNVQISPGSVVAGGVEIGRDSFIGINASIIQGVKIGASVIVGAGSVVIEDVPDNCVVVGNPARIIKYK